MTQIEKLDYLIDYLLNENKADMSFFDTYKRDTLNHKFELFRGLCNVRSPKPVSDEFIQIQNEFLTAWNISQTLTSINELNAVKPHIYIWQGDITHLKIDAIVNAANSRFIGCTLANHTCIDNIIHTKAGVQLRLECDEIIQQQGRKEPTGKAKITKGYNLPASYVIHTVGPYIDERGVSPLKESLLASSYQSVLELADQNNVSSIAFCCISTGEFNFPNEQAAEIAIKTVSNYLKETDSKIHVIFNVFKNKDLHIYQSLLEK